MRRAGPRTARLRSGAAVVLAAILLSPLLVGQERVGAGPPGRAPAPWNRFEAILWLHGGPARDGAFFATIKRAGITAVSVDGDEDPALPSRHGLRFYLEHAAGKGDLHVRPRDFAVVQAEYEKARDPSVLIRPSLLLDPATTGRLAATVTTRAARAGPLAPLAVSLDDEISTTSFINPLDLCFHESSLAGFRDFLARRHGSLVELNAAWESSFSSWAVVRPMTADEIRRREFGIPGLPRNLAPWAEHREFMDVVFADLVTALCGAARAAAPGARVGFTGGQAPSAYGGHDYSRLVAGCDFVEVYDIGGARDLAASLLPRGSRRFETLVRPEGPDLADLVKARVFDGLAHGLSGIVIWSAGDFISEAGLSPYGEAVSRCLPAATGDLGSRLVASSVAPSPIAILESQPSVRAHWMLDSRGDGATWIRRLSTHESAHSTSQAARLAWIRCLEDLGHQPRFLTEKQVMDGVLEVTGGPSALVLPSLLALSDDVAARIERFASAGGLVLADSAPGWYRPDLVLRDAPALDRLFGVEGRRRAKTGPAVCEGRVVPGTARTKLGLAIAEAGIRLGADVIARESDTQIERRVGRGRAVLLNVVLCEYARFRLDRARLREAVELRAMVRCALDRVGIEPPFHVRVEGAPTCVERFVYRGPQGETLVVRLNALDDPALLHELAARGRLPMRVDLPVERRVKDLLGGTDFGWTRSFTAELDPLTGAFFSAETRGR